MRKTLLFAAALCLASTAMAQTLSNPLTVVEGENTYDVTKAGSTYWTFTADDDYIASIGQYEESDIPDVAIKSGIKRTQIGGATAADYTTKIYALEKGKTYYFILNSETKGKVGFTLKLEKTKNLGVGLSEDNPLEIKLGETQVFGNPHRDSEDYEAVNVYSTYKAEKDGQLRLKTSQYVSSATVNGTKVSVETENGQKVFKINTKAGETYAINFNISIPFFIATSEVVEVKEGSIDMPFSLKEGENKVPAEAGKYYFTYKPTHTGYLNIESDASLQDGQVSIYRNKLNASAGNYAQGTSEKGSYNVRTEATSLFYTYYIVVDKKTATANADTFKFQMENYKPGENPDAPIAVEISDATPTPSVTLPSAKGTYYYSVTVPANTKKLLLVESATDLSAGSSVSLNIGTGTWGATKMENKILKKDVTSTVDKTYLLTVTSNETTPLKLNFSYIDIEKGSLSTMPKEAIAGKNTIDFDNAEYYTYKATQDGKLAITVSDGVTVQIDDPNADAKTDTYQKGNVFFASATKNTTYNITITGVKKGDSFNLAETEFDAGEVRSTAIKMTGDTYTLGDNTANLWLEYDVAKNGVIELSCDVPFDYDYSLGVAKNTNDAVCSMVNSDYNYDKSYQSVFPVKANDKLYILINMAGDVKGKTLTLTNRESKPGETIDNPLVIKKGEVVDLTIAGSTKPLWIKPQQEEATSTYIVYDGSCVPVAYCQPSGDDINYDGGVMMWGDDVTMPDGSFGSELPIYNGQIIMINSVTGPAKLLYMDDTANGISNIETETDNKPSIYTVDGRKVDQISGNGVYIIKANGATKKVVIKK